jgi:hypothetical protein
MHLDLKTHGSSAYESDSDPGSGSKDNAGAPVSPTNIQLKKPLPSRCKCYPQSVLFRLAAGTSVQLAATMAVHFVVWSGITTSCTLSVSAGFVIASLITGAVMLFISLWFYCK